MDINTIIEEKIKEELNLFLERYNNRDYLTSEEASKELGLKSADNLRKQINKYKGLCKVEGTSAKPRYKWSKFSLAKYIFTNKTEQLKSA